MTRVAASAPGKGVRCGEYAVLAGAPAISVAVDRRATVQMQQVAGEGVVRTLSDAEREYRFGIDGDGAIEWRGRTGVPVIDHAWRSGEHVNAMNITLDTREFFDRLTGEKYGFGSSAALTSALVRAFAARHGGVSELRDRAAAAHRAFQGGAGSGVDIATSVQGGLIRFEPGADPVCTNLDWPVALRWKVVWTGRGASTGQQLRKLGTMNEADETTGELLRQSRVAAAAWAGGDVSSILAETRRFAEILRRFSDARQLGVYSAGHSELQDMADRIGILYKPCGAGGGDIGAAFAADDAAITSFAAQAKEAGFRVMDVSPDLRGASIDHEIDDE